MSLTYWKQNSSGGAGNYTPFSLYYEEDRQIVLNQTGPQGETATSAGLVNYVFRNEAVTVFVARDSSGNVLPLVGLPCPPYYHDETPEALPGNILTE